MESWFQFAKQYQLFWKLQRLLNKKNSCCFIVRKQFFVPVIGVSTTVWLFSLALCLYSQTSDIISVHLFQLMKFNVCPPHPLPTLTHLACVFVSWAFLLSFSVTSLSNCISSSCQMDHQSMLYKYIKAWCFWTRKATYCFLPTKREPSVWLNQQVSGINSIAVWGHYLWECSLCVGGKGFHIHTT